MVNTGSYRSNKIMPNSDNQYGTFNKRTQILTQVDDGSTALQNFADVETAKAWFYTADALAVFDECCTELQWSVVDNQKLKYTMTFGTKGTPNIAPADDWAGQFNSRKQALMDSRGWANNGYTTTETDSHLF
jgi:hypothetical protein